MLLISWNGQLKFMCLTGADCSPTMSTREWLDMDWHPGASSPVAFSTCYSPCSEEAGLYTQPLVESVNVQNRLSPKSVDSTQMLQPRRGNSIFRVARWFLYAMPPCLLLVAEARSATPLLRCQLGQSDVQRTVEFVPVSDPYTVKAVDINGRFRFKAVVVGNEQSIN